MNDHAPDAALHDGRLSLINDSYCRLTGKILIDPFDPEALWNVNRAIVAHGLEADPVFFYGNRMALQCFGMSFEEFAQLPSRFSAEPVVQPLRAALLEQVAKQGYVDNYAGVRIAKGGRRFTIAGGTVWNLVDAAGICHGQAATFIVQP